MADPLKRICEELGVCQEEALFYLEGFRWDLNAAMEACRSKTLLLPENERAAAEVRRRNEQIVQFLEVASGSSTDDAHNYLSRSNWNMEQAAHSFYEDRFEHTEKKSKPMPLSHDGNTAPWYMHGFSGNEGSDVMQDVLSSVPLFHNTSTNLRIGSPDPSASTPPPNLTQESIKQFREVISGASPSTILDCVNHGKGDVTDAISHYYDVYSESGSEIATAEVVKIFSGVAVDQDSSIPTETQRSLKKAGEGDVTVAIPGMAKAHVEEHVKELSPVPITTTVELEISLDDGESGTHVWILVRSDQTVRDIRNRIDAFRPEDKRDYYLKSDTGVEYRDLDTTAHSITSGSRGSTTLHQLYST